jgi:hypothetical protein
VNGPGITGSVPVGTTRLYTLANIISDPSHTYAYTVRTTIATLGTGTTPDGTLNVSIYTSEDAFKSDPTNSVAVLTPDANFPYVYEAYFKAPSSGNYVAAISGASQSISDTQFFYDLRVMSASPPYLTPVTTSVTSTTFQAYSGNVGAITDYLGVFSGESPTQSGSYPIKLVASSVTVTTAYPQMFVYKDQSLKISSLLKSSVTVSMNFVVTDFISSPTGSALAPDPNNALATGVTITGVPFSNSGPFIVVRGTSPTQYQLFLGPGP